MTISRVVVRAPATIANLGPGFDAMGLALAWYDEIKVEHHPGGLEITASGLGSEGVTRDDSNLVVRGLNAALGEPPGVRIHTMTAVAFGRGFGSSAISIVAGLVAARALFSTGHSDDELLRLAIEIEGHADNVAPCLLGGITVVSGEAVTRLEPPAGIDALVCVAPTRLSTTVARAALPDTVARADAVANLARAALLAASLATGRTDTLMEATEDLLHQPVRFELMPDSGELVRALRGKGIAAFLAGAGPSVAGLVPAERAEEAQAVARGLAPEAWDVRLEGFDAHGATVVEQRGA